MADEQAPQPQPWEALRQRAADPSAVSYVRPTGEIEVYQKGGFADEQHQMLEKRGLKLASPEDIERRATHLENSTTSQQTRAALDLAMTTATFGAVGKEELELPTDKPGAIEARREALESESPGVALGARIVGGAIPMVLSGGAAGALGAGAIAVGAAEGVGAGLAEESAQAKWENRELSAGNVALAGLGGALFAGVLPAVLRRGSKALGPTDAVAAAAGDVAENIAPRLEAQANARAAKVIGDMKPGPARDAVLTQGADAHLERVQQEVSDVVTRAPESLANSDIDKATLKRLMPRDAPAQTKWATDTAEQLREMAGRPATVANDVAAEATSATAAAPKSPISLAGKSLEDLKALPIEGEGDLSRVASLKEHADFAKSGRVSANDAAQGITVVDDGGEMVLRDGRHRLTAAQEMGRDSVYGRYVDGKTGKTLFEGEIPIKGGAESAPAQNRVRAPAAKSIEELAPVKARTDGLWKTLSDDERKAVESYTQSGDRYQRMARGAETDTAGELPALQAALKKLSIEEPTQYGPLFRGTSLDAESLAKLKPGSTTTLGSTMPSTSYFEDLAQTFATSGKGEGGTPVLYEIEHVSAGSPKFGDEIRGAGPRGNRRHPALDKEAEVMLDGSKNYRVVSSEKTMLKNRQGQPVEGTRVRLAEDIPTGADEAAPASSVRRTAKGARIGELRKGEGSPIDLSEWDMGDFVKAKGTGKAAGKGTHGYSGGDTVSQYQRSIVDGLKENAQFASTGRISGDAGKLGSEPTIHVLPDSSMQLGHGRLRITAARELGLTEIYGRVMIGTGKGAKQVYEGMIPVGRAGAKAAERAAPVAAEAAPAAVPHGDLLREASASLLESKGGLDTMVRAREALGNLRRAGAPQEAIDALQKGIADQSLFGRAAEAAADFDAAHAKMPSSPAEGFSPSNVTQEARQRLTAAAEALEDRAAVRAKWDMGGAKDPHSKRLIQDAQRLKGGLGLSDDVAGAQGRASATTAAEAAPKPKRGFGGEVVDYLKESALDYIIPGSGLARRGAKFLWSSVDASGRESIRQAARSAARGAMGAAERAAGVVGRAAPTALETFTGDFPGPREAFSARRDMLQEMMRNPTALPTALAESLGDMPRENPALFAQVSARMARASAYVTANLPAQVAASMVNPRGVAPSHDTLRDFAVVWNSAMHPETVIDAVSDGSASPGQMRALETVDPDSYANLQTDVIAELGQNYEQTTAQTKQWLDILFGSDGIAGPAYSWKAADYMSQSAAARGNKPMPLGALPPPSEQAPTSSGIEAIKKGVTNRAGGV